MDINEYMSYIYVRMYMYYVGVCTGRYLVGMIYHWVKFGVILYFLYSFLLRRIQVRLNYARKSLPPPTSFSCITALSAMFSR